MTALVTRVFGGKAGVYQKPAAGDPLAPFEDPGAHLDKVFFHSDLDFYRVHSGPDDMSVTLPAVAGATRSFAGNPPFNIVGQFATSDILLLNHGLGYVPNYQIIWNGGTLVSGAIVQWVDDSNGIRGRYLSHWADATSIYLQSLGASSAVALAAMTFDCQVVVFKLGAEAGNVVFDFDTISGRLRMGKGTFDSDEKLLRAAGQPDDSPYDISVGQSIDIRNGRTRVALPNGTVTSQNGYSGAFVPPAAFQGVIE